MNDGQKEHSDNYSTLITTGCLLWVVAFFTEANGLQPYSTVAIFISPIITLVGIFFWLKHYRATRGHYPRLKTIASNTEHTGGGHFTLNSDFLFSHLLEFWTACMLFWMGMVLLMVLTFGRSDAFEATKKYCESTHEIVEQTGAVKYYGVLVAGNISSKDNSGNADLSFTIVGEKGNFKAKSILTKENGIWKVESVELKD